VDHDREGRGSWTTILLYRLTHSRTQDRYALPVNAAFTGSAYRSAWAVFTARIYGCILTPVHTASMYAPYVRVLRIGHPCVRPVYTVNFSTAVHTGRSRTYIRVSKNAAVYTVCVSGPYLREVCISAIRMFRLFGRTGPTNLGANI